MSGARNRGKQPLLWRDGGEERLVSYIATKPPGPEVEQAREAFRHAQNTELRNLMLEYFQLVEPRPGQSPDTQLGTVAPMRKRSGAMRFYGRVSDIEKQQWGTKIRCALNCDGMDVFKLRQAVERMHDRQLGQMQNPDLKSAGLVLRAEVAGDGMVDLVAVVTDPIAVTKVSERAYTGILCSFDGDEIASINLIDSPAAFMAKSSRVICKLYDGGGAVSEWKAARRALERAGIRPATVITAVEAAVRKSSERRLPVSAQQAFAEIEGTEKALESGTCGDRMAATAQNQRARQLLGVEFIKAARQTGNRLWGPKFG